MAIHHWEGSSNNKIGFVFSSPGHAEENTGRPVAGATGENMDSILKYLNNWNSNYFSSIDRYQYLITNASTKIMYSGKNEGKTEDTNSNITDATNIKRLNCELAKCKIVILCGRKAHLLEQHLKNKIVIKTPHLGNVGLRNEYKNRHYSLKNIKVGNQRDLIRLRLCAENIIHQLEVCLAIN